MQRDLLLLGEMIQAAERARHLADGLTLSQLQDDRMRTESLLRNFTVLGEASTQLSSELKDRFPRIPWQHPPACGTGSCTAKNGPSTENPSASPVTTTSPQPPTSARSLGDISKPDD